MEIEYVKPDETMREQINAIIEQNAMILKMNAEIINMMKPIQILDYSHNCEEAKSGKG